MTNVPDWATDYITKWRDILYLHGWTTITKLSPHPDNDPDNNACVTLYPEINEAHITIRDDIPASQDGLSIEDLSQWQKIIIHELIHIRMAGVTTPIEEEILAELSPAAQRIARGVFSREIEKFTDLLAEILHKLTYSQIIDKTDKMK